MRASEKSEGHSLITANKQVRDIEAHCRKVRAEAVIESFKILFFAPMNVSERLFCKEKKAIDRGQEEVS